MKKLATHMYKNQKLLSTSSFIWALLVTAVVLLLASSASAETDEANTTTSTNGDVSSETISEERRKLDERDVKPREIPALPPQARPNQQLLEERQAQLSANKETREGQLQDFKEGQKANLEQRKLDMEGRKAEMEERKAVLEERKVVWEQELEKRRSSLEEKRQALASSTLARRAALGEKVQERITARTDKLKEILSKGIIKTKEISDRLRSRALDLQERGADVSTTLANLDQVNTLLATAEQALVGIEINAEYTVTSDKPKADWSEMKSQATTVRDLIKEAQVLLKTTVEALKSAMREAKENIDVDSESLNSETTN